MCSHHSWVKFTTLASDSSFLLILTLRGNNHSFNSWLCLSVYFSNKKTDSVQGAYFFLLMLLLKNNVRSSSDGNKLLKKFLFNLLVQCVFITFIYFFYLFKRQNDRDLSFICSLATQLQTTAGGGSGYSQEPGTLHLPCWGRNTGKKLYQKQRWSQIPSTF